MNPAIGKELAAIVSLTTGLGKNCQPVFFLPRLRDFMIDR